MTSATNQARNQVQLLVDGQRFEGWKRLEVSTSIEQMAGAFVLQVTLRWDGQGQPYALREGLPCQLLLGDDVVVTGYIDDFEVDFDAQAISVNVHGRDKTADLVDCSAIHKTGQWRNASLVQIVRDIALPFGVGVVVEDGAELGEAFKSFALEEGETAFAAIDRACRTRAVLCTSTEVGEVLLTRANDDDSVVQLIEGVNIKSGTATHTWKERHSVITLKGQAQGDDNEYGATVAHAKAVGTDAEINRYRPLVVVAEHGAGLKALQDRAKWEVAVRMGRGKRGRIKVVGWRQGRDGLVGALWRKNTMVYIDSPTLNLARDMLVVGCTYRLTEQGAETELTFARREAFEVVEGVRRSRLSGRINDKTQKEKKKKGDGYQASWEPTPPTKGTP